MSDNSIFNLIRRLCYFWPLKKNGTNWPDVDTCINDDFSLLYAQWICTTFPYFDWFYNKI